jgi:hypothetical protein
MRDQSGRPCRMSHGTPEPLSRPKETMQAYRPLKAWEVAARLTKIEAAYRP